MAGNGYGLFAGDGGPATSASLNSPAGLTVDASGNLYIADTGNNAIRRVDAITGIITTVAGTGAAGFNGDGIPATTATLNEPSSVILNSGNLVFAELGSNRVRTIDNSGIIWTIAGNGSSSGTQNGDNGPASLAVLSHPFGLAGRPSEPLFISELTGDRVRVDGLPGSLAATAATLTSSAATSPYGAAVTLTVTLLASNGMASSASGGVYFLDGSSTLIGSAAVVNGSASITISTLALGVHNISAEYTGSAGFGGSFSPTFALTIGPPATTVLLNVNPNPPAVNQPVSLTALLTPSSATGTVNFYNGTALLGSAGVSGGTATLNLPGLAAGTYSLTAQYGGDSSHAAATSPAVNLSVRNTSSIVLTSGLNPSLSGQSVTFTSAVTPASAAGSVQFLDGGSQIGAAAIASGTASFTTSSLTSGQHSITVSYGGDANDTSAVSAVLTQTVNPLTTTTTMVQSSQNPVLAGGSVAFTASVSPSTATGTVQFLDGGIVIGAGILSGGTTSFSTSALATGTHLMTAAYSGDTANAASTSAVLSQAVRISAGLAMTITPSTVVAGQTVAIIATLNAAATGTVKFTDGSTVLATVSVAAGAASYSASFTQGSHVITAAYSGDSTRMSASSGINETVLAALGGGPDHQPESVDAGPERHLHRIRHAFRGDGGRAVSRWGAVIGTASLISGVANFSTSSLAAGSHSLTAAYGGDASDSTASSTPLSQTVKIAAGVAVASSPNPAITGQTVTITASVTPSTATGTVQFLDGATVLGTAAVSSGTAVFTTSALAQGAHVLTAAYSGDANDAAAVSSGSTQTVNPKNPTTTALSSNLNPAPVGSSVGFTATVSSGATGSVQFFDGAALLGSGSIVGTTVSLTTATLTQGTHSITAVYGGDSINAPSTSAVLTEIVKLNAGLNLLTSLNPSVVGQTVTFTATLNAAATGTVQFLDGSTVLGTATASGGSAAFSTSSLTQGSHIMSANYSGDSNYSSQVSVGITQTVNAKATTATTVTSASNPAIVGAAVAFTATVSPSTATGTVQLLDGATVLGTGTLANGAASFNISTLAVGAHAITAVYGGDAVNAGSTSAVFTETINAKAATVATVASSQNPGLVGVPVTFTAAVSPATATGTVQFLDGGTILGAGTLANGTTTFTTSSLAQGTHSITAVYAGDAADAGSTSAALSQVMKLPAGLTTGVSPSPAVAGQTVKITAAMNSGATGTVQFTDGGAVLATVPVASGAASFSTSTLSQGSHTLGVVYSGDGTYMSASASFPETVLAVSKVVVASNVNPSDVGQSVTFTASVTPSTATGTVQFYDGGTSIGAASLASGSASFSTASLGKGTHSLSAAYGGDAADAAAASATLNQIVKAAAAVSLTSSVNPSTVGQAVTFSASVTPSAATGTIQFLNGSTVLGTVNVSSGNAVFSTSSLAAGAHSITASYGGDTYDAAATSTALTQTVNVAAPAAPSNLTATASGSSQINLAWHASATSGVTYNVYGSTSAGFMPSASNRLATGVATTSYDATGLSASTAYYFRVTAVNAGGESASTHQANATTAGAFACHVSYSVTTQWNVGFGGAISIQNTGTVGITSWTLTWTWPGNQAVTESWNATYQQSGPNVTLTNESYNKQIAAGATLTGMGFNASYSGTNPAPTAFYVNGTLCH